MFLKHFLRLTFLLSLSSLALAGADGDGVPDDTDNCPGIANADQLDTDSDGLGNKCDVDDDGDGVIDEGDPWPEDNRYKVDSDGDGQPDSWEIRFGLDPNSAEDANEDADSDGLSNGEEFAFDTNPLADDTDGDTLTDWWEVQNDKSPTVHNYPVAVGYDHCMIDDLGLRCWDYFDGTIFDRPTPTFSKVMDFAKLDDNSYSYSYTCTEDVYSRHIYNDSFCVLSKLESVCWTYQRLDKTAFCEDPQSPEQWFTKVERKPFSSASEIAIWDVVKCVAEETKVTCWVNEDWLSYEKIFPAQRPTGLSLRPGPSGSRADVSVCFTDDSGFRCEGEPYWHYEEALSIASNAKEIKYDQNAYGSCILADGSVTCWSNFEGNSAYGIERPLDLTEQFDLSVARERACSLDREGGLSCWGLSGDPIKQLNETLIDPLQVHAGRYVTCVWAKEGLVCNGGGGILRPSVMIDPDGDGYSNQNSNDAFPLDSSEWLDTDSDGLGNNADLDDDNDGVADDVDFFPLDVNESADTDLDGVGDNADAFPNDDSETVDSDLDGVGDNSDNCVSEVNTGQLDTDGDTLGNECDPDDDNDGLNDDTDAFPLDATEQIDSDGDGVGNNADAFPNDPTEASDLDRDGVGDNADAFDDDAQESVDTDGDGIGNNADLDDDNDGFSDEQEAIDGTNPLSRFSCKSGCFSFDVDENLEAQPLTDGLLVIRHLFGFSGDSLISGAVSGEAGRGSSEAITSYLTDGVSELDIDGDGTSGALTDGLLLIRYLFGFSGGTLLSGAIGDGAERNSAVAVEAYIEERIPVQ